MLFDPELPQAIAETPDLAKAFFIGIGLLIGLAIELFCSLLDWIDRKRKKNIDKDRKE